jgi:hypothetical protein
VRRGLRRVVFSDRGNNALLAFQYLARHKPIFTATG